MSQITVFPSPPDNVLLKELMKGLAFLLLCVLVTVWCSAYASESTDFRGDIARGTDEQSLSAVGSPGDKERPERPERPEHPDHPDHPKDPDEPPPPVENPLPVENSLSYPTRIAQGPDGKIYVTDARVGSVFIYSADMTEVVGELKGLGKSVLGVAVDAQGNIYVGSNSRDNVEVYSPTGEMLYSIEGILVPNDLALDKDGNLYIVDSLNDVVKVYDSAGNWLRDVGSAGSADGQFRFPIAVAVAYRPDPNNPDLEIGEVFVADQGNVRLHVFGLGGGLDRAYGEAIPSFSDDWEGRFARLQGLAVDSQYRLHVLDSYLNRVQILNADSGEFISAYGLEPGLLRVPLDMLITPSGQAVVTNSARHRLEVLATTP